ncbi:radical SAM protein [Vibrio alfacsensis]|uniref:Radical SAM protein n=1 Tax=Vibrio alfacsensis TaxID=1074311 RepID=A0ABM6YSZ7_9VIBR|nr:radical SAM protein [Vibrio alfacsensis]AXY00921.1 radical SAM protein [Vibrio alfacsensis]
MSFNISSPFMGLDYSIHTDQSTAKLALHACDGDILSPLVKIELTLAESGIKTIVITNTPLATKQQVRLKKLNYHLTHDQNYQKAVTYRKSVRFSVTEKCNYHCFFCHEEGMEMEVKRETSSNETFFDVIKQLAELNYDDFTFTGGEPLLNWRTVDACMSYMETINYLPEVTIVTNGERLNPRMLERLSSYPGKVRLNLSLHSFLDDEYLEIVHRKKKPGFGSDTLLDTIKQKMVMLNEANIPFKLNVVLLKDINTSHQSLSAILKYAAEYNATSVKFLELLITEKLRNFYPYFYTLDSVKQTLKDELTLVWQNQKKDVYQYQDTSLEVELQHCPCARGCNTCLLNRGVTFTAEMKFFPCFLNPQDNYALSDNNLAECVEKGDDYIEIMAKHYQDNSPILIRESYSTKREQAYFYVINSSDKQSISRLLKGRLTRIRTFNEQYFSKPEQPRYEICKLATNTHEEHAYSLEVKQRIDADTQGLHISEFLHEGIKVYDRQCYLDAMLKEGFEQSHTLDWEIEYYATKNESFSISANKQTGLLFLRTQAPFELLSIKSEPVTVPLPVYIQSLLTS